MLALVIGSGVGAVAVENGAALANSLDLQEQLRHAGADVLIVEPASGAGPLVLSTSECAALNSRPFVKHAGAIMSSTFIETLPTPGQRYREIMTTTGTVSIILDEDTNLVGNQAIISPALADDLRIRVGSFLGGAGTASEPRISEVADVLPLDVRLRELGRAALVLGPPVGSADQCLIEVDAEYYPTAREGDILAAFSSPPRSISGTWIAGGGRLVWGEWVTCRPGFR